MITETSEEVLERTLYFDRIYNVIFGNSTLEPIDFWYTNGRSKSRRAEAWDELIILMSEILNKSS